MENTVILMSTYNGENYIEDQLKSLQNQTYTNWHLYIRDDGSKDKTKKIIQRYCDTDSRITLIDDGKNLGPSRSFLTLVEMIDADYYFFCDQDDYWIKDKLQIMINEIKKYNNLKPQVVYCNLKCVDQNLKPQKYGFENLIGKISGLNRFIGNDMPGCVMLFNKETRELVNKYRPDYNSITMHDWWIALVAQVFGEVHFVNRKLIYYRQHGDNTLGAGKPGNTIKKLFQRDLIKKQKDLVKQTFSQDMEFRKTFYMILPNNVKQLLDNMKQCKSETVIFRIKFIKHYSLKQMSFIRTFAYNWAFIFMLKN